MDGFSWWIRMVALVICCVGIGFGCGKDFARDYVVKEAARCLEAPDMDTARVCWDTATLGWKP